MAITRLKTWGAEVLTHTDLNAEFDNIINNLTPANIGDYSANVGEMRTTVDPYPTGAPSLATDLSGELARIRYVLAQITGNTYWYQDPATSLLTLPSIFGLSTSVNTNSLTITLTDKDGTALSSTNTANLSFRSATLSSGVQVIRTINSSTTFTLSAGSSLGFVDNETGRIYVWAIDNAGTVELAVSRTADIFPESSLVSTTAEGGVGGADSATVMYSATARSNVACRLLGYLVIQTGSTAGNWSSSPSQIQIVPSYVPRTIIANLKSTNTLPLQIESDVDGTYGLIYDSGALTDEVNTVTIDGLDAATHGGYKFEFSINNTTASNALYVMFYNNQTTGTDYKRNWYGGESNDACVHYTYVSASGSIFLNGAIMQSTSGVVSSHHKSLAINSSGDASEGTIVSQWKKTAVSGSNLTRIDIAAKQADLTTALTDGIGIGSRFRIWRRI